MMNDHNNTGLTIEKFLSSDISEKEARSCIDEFDANPDVLDEFADHFTVDRLLCSMQGADEMSDKIYRSVRSLDRSDSFKGRIEDTCAKRLSLPANKRFRTQRKTTWIKPVISWLTAACIIIAASAFFVHFDRPAPTDVEQPAPVWDVTMVNADVWVLHNGEKTSIGPEGNIFSGDSIYTGPEGSAIITHTQEDTSLILKERTTCTLVEKQGSKEIQLQKGTIECDAALQKPNTTLQVITDHARAVVKGTLFQVRAEKKYTRLEVQQGRVELVRRSDGARTEVTRGSYAEAGPGILPESKPITVEPEQPIEEKVEETVEVLENLPAFPGASGFGALTTGGRGGDVLFVTSTADSGPGSLRSACKRAGPRTVVFRTGGTVDLRKHIIIKNPFITVAGQTAPGMGICLKGAGIRVKTHDVIIRGIRIRPGDGPGADPRNRDALAIENPNEAPYNIIVDHCSFSWAVDENVSLWHPCRDITLQWCAITESLDNSVHPKGRVGHGMVIGSGSRNISIHNCLIAFNREANPLISSNTRVEMVHNIIAGWRKAGMQLAGGSIRVNLLGNIFMPLEHAEKKTITAAGRVGSIDVFMENNYMNSYLPKQSDLIVNISNVHLNNPVFRLSSETTVSKPDPDKVFAKAGVSYKRDRVDKQIVEHIRLAKGSMIDSPSDAGGYPVLDAGEPYPDRDNDGISDTWEVNKGLDPDDRSDSRRKSPQGYTWLEVWINSLIP